MTLDLSGYAAATGLLSGSQVARVATEKWAKDNLYCPGCPSDQLWPTAANTPAIDFYCPNCLLNFQLKSRKGWDRNRIVDAAYDKMIAAIRSDGAPNLLVLGYSGGWQIERLLLVPSFFFSESVVEKRTPLGPLARRSGWVGCNILLKDIAPQGRISMVYEGLEAHPSEVRASFAQVRPLQTIPPEIRGWALDVLTAAESLKMREFSLSGLYGQESRLAVLHPNNRNIRPKIRQQLQVLRDLGLVEFLGNGRYRLIEVGRT